MTTYNLVATGVPVSQAITSGVTSVNVKNNGPTFISVAFGTAGVLATQGDRRLAPGSSDNFTMPLGTSAMSVIADGRRFPCPVTVVEGAVDPRVASAAGGGGGVLATISGSYIAGQTLTAAYPAGTIGTIQFTHTMIASPFTKSAISGAVASAVNSLTYPLTTADLPYTIGVDCSNQVSSVVGGVIAGAPVGTTGFDIILMAGQSNMAGRAVIGSYVDTPNAAVQQWGSYATNTATYQKIVQAADPLSFPDATTAGGTSGPALWFARSYLSTLASGRQVLIVPVAIGGQAMVAAGAPWHPGSPGGVTFEMAVARSNEAIAAAVAAYPSSKFVGIAWLQGESDGDASVSQADYDTNLRLVVSTLRSRITGAANSWFVLGGMVPEALTAHPLYLPIKAAQKAVVASVQRMAYIEGISGYSADNLHYTVLAGVQQVGPQIAGIIPTAIAAVQQAGVAPVASVAPVVTGSTVQGGTLFCTQGTWSNYPDSYTYQWLRAGTPVAGATASSYPTVLADVGSTISCRVTATAGGTAGGSTSTATAVITAGGSTTTTVYSFEADTVGAQPANTTATNGTYEIVASVGADTTKALHMSVSQTAPNPGALSFDLLTSANADQTLTWRRQQTTASARDGMLLRPQAAFTTLASNTTIRQGYLFQTSTAQGALRVFSVTASAVTQIGSNFTLDTSTATHFKASCIGSTITFSYSTDNMATWIAAITVTNTDNPAASAAAVQWINIAASLTAFVDDVTLTA